MREDSIKEVSAWAGIAVTRRKRRLTMARKKNDQPQELVEERGELESGTAGGSQPEDEGGCCCCVAKTKERSEEEYKSLLHRLNRIEGQVRGIRRMVERNAYCTDILTQSAAVTAAINAFNKELLANHIRTCVVRDIQDGKDEVVDELVSTLQRLMK